LRIAVVDVQVMDGVDHDLLPFRGPSRLSLHGRLSLLADDEPELTREIASAQLADLPPGDPPLPVDEERLGWREDLVGLSHLSGDVHGRWPGGLHASHEGAGCLRPV